MYLYGLGCVKSEKKSVEYFKSSAKQGESEAEYFLSIAYLNGSGVSKDEIVGIDLLRISAEQNHFFPSLYLLGLFYDMGKYVEQNKEKASDLYQQSHEYFKEQYKDLGEFYSHIVGRMYQYERGVEQDNAKAFEWYEKGANQNHQWAQYEFGKCYETGIGTEPNFIKAKEWYARSANQGYVEAKLALDSLEDIL